MTNRPELDLLTLLGFGILSLVFVAYEIAGLTLPGVHTISYLSHGHITLRVLILALFVLLPFWWWWHSGHQILR